MSKNIVISPMGGPTNKMIQYLAAKGILAHCLDAEIFGADIPNWNIKTKEKPEHFGRTVGFKDSVHRLDVAGIASCLNRGAINSVYINSYAQHIENYPNLESCRNSFPSQLDKLSIRFFHSDELLINIRGNEINDGRHPDYLLLPVSFYADLIEKTKLKPVFFGQIEDSVYSLALRARFPNAEFIASNSFLHDFETLRNAKNVVPSISTFSWLACWLGSSTQIHMPVAGLFNPRQARQHHFLPLDDTRFNFYLFPICYSVDIFRQAAELFSTHQSIEKDIKLVRADTLKSIIKKSPINERKLDHYLQYYNEDYYLGCQPDIAAAVKAGHLQSGLSHYIEHGFIEERRCFHLNHRSYARNYPIAAVEVSSGEYLDFDHHYVEIGALRGYLAY